MIDMNKQYTYNNKPARIYAAGIDCSLGLIHGAYQNDEDGTWYCKAFKESDLVKVWNPVEGELCYFWDKYSRVILIDKFMCMSANKYTDSESVSWDSCASFNGTLPKEFKGLV